MAPEQITAAITAKLESVGYTVKTTRRIPPRSGIKRGAMGATNRVTRVVWLRERAPEQMAQTLLHEAAHVLTMSILAAWPGAEEGDAEVVAEGAAMIAGHTLGVNDPESMEYIAGWMADTGLSASVLAKLSRAAAHELVNVAEGGEK